MAPKGSTIPKPPCKLVGTDGNVFAVIANVSRALKRAGQADRAAEWTKKAMESKSYDDVLILLHSYVEAE